MVFNSVNEIRAVSYNECRPVVRHALLFNSSIAELSNFYSRRGWVNAAIQHLPVLESRPGLNSRPGPALKRCGDAWLENWLGFKIWNFLARHTLQTAKQTGTQKQLYSLLVATVQCICPKHDLLVYLLSMLCLCPVYVASICSPCPIFVPLCQAM